MTDITQILYRAQGVVPGGVSEVELQYARKILRDKSEPADQALLIVGLAGNQNDSVLIEPYLFDQNDDYLAGIALKCLCRYLGLINTYKDYVKSFLMRDISFDFSERQLNAIYLAKQYFESNKDDNLGCRLVDICQSAGDDEGLLHAVSLALSSIVAFPAPEDDPHILRIKSDSAWVFDLIEYSKKYFNCR